MIYRNKVCCLVVVSFITSLIFSSSVVAQKEEKGWVNLFDGKTLNGWRKLGGTATYTVEDGVIVGTTVAGSPNTFLATEKEYGDFILEVDIKLESQRGNSGVQTRSQIRLIIFS